jgi:hypothetical protein
MQGLLFIFFSVSTLLVGINDVKAEKNVYLDQVHNYSFAIPNKYSDNSEEYYKNKSLINNSVMKPGAIILRNDKNAFCKTWTFSLAPNQKAYTFTHEKLSNVMFQHTVKQETSGLNLAINSIDKYKIVNEEIIKLQGHELSLKVYDLLSSELSSFSDYRIRMLTALIFNPSTDYFTYTDRKKDYIYLSCSTYGRPSIVELTSNDFYELVRSFKFNQ